MLDALFLMEPNYSLAYALVALSLLLGVVVVCIPRPRKSEIPKDDE